MHVEMRERAFGSDRQADLSPLSLSLSLFSSGFLPFVFDEWRCFHCVFTEITEPAGCYFSADSDSRTATAAGETIIALLHF